MSAHTEINTQLADIKAELAEVRDLILQHLSGVPNPKMVGTREAAEALGISEETVRIRCAEGRLRHKREGRKLRFQRGWLQEYLKQESISPNRVLSRRAR